MSCPTCHYANDHTFRFCQNCGYSRRRVHNLVPTPVTFNLSAIDDRINFLQSSHLSTAYSKQKQSLKIELESFLFALPGQKSLFDATPLDVCRFLVFKDLKGKTQVHKSGCPYLGQRGTSLCQCPLRLAYSTVDSYIGKLRSIFSEVGRQGDWNRTLLLGNPATDLLVKQYLKEVTAEQLQARVAPKQASPIFLDKLLLLSRHLEKRLLLTSLTPTDIFITARDQAFFKTLFFSGDRGGDLGQVKTPEIARFPDDNGFLFNHIWGKTLRDGASNIFGMRRHPNPTLCPIKGIETYVAIAQELGISLSSGHLFRATNQQGHIVDKPLLSSTAESGLKKYLRDAHIDNGETLHSFRSGCAVTLALSGSPLADVMSHVGWMNSKTALYYLKLADVLRAGAPCDLLASDSYLPQSREASRVYLDFNDLKNFVTAFPATSFPKRLLPS